MRWFHRRFRSPFSLLAGGGASSSGQFFNHLDDWNEARDALDESIPLLELVAHGRSVTSKAREFQAALRKAREKTIDPAVAKIERDGGSGLPYWDEPAKIIEIAAARRAFEGYLEAARSELNGSLIR